MDVQIDLVRENPEVGRFYHLTCSNGRTFEVGLQYRQAGPFRLVYGWIDEQHYNIPGKQWRDPDEALREITEHIRGLCQHEPMIARSDPIPWTRKADPDQVIRRYQVLHNLQRTGDEFGISRERVRQLVNRAGINTARILKPKPEKPARLCKQCGALVNSSIALYCETHRTSQQKAWRRYQRIKADPQKYAQWRAQLKTYEERYRARKRDQPKS